MMKKLLSFFLVLLLLSLSVITVSAASGDLAEVGKTIISEGYWVYEAIDGGSHLSIDQYTGNKTDLVIPRIVNNLMVTKIGSYCFYDSTSVSSVVTSSPLWTVGEYAFLKCTSLESFECNFALKDIEVGAFSGTTSLKSINLEDSVITVVKPHVFMDSGIEQVTLPDTCTEIMHDAFSQCAELTKIVIPASVTTIDADSFRMSENVVIYCYTDSCAHQFAVSKNIPFVLLDEEPDEYMLGDADNSGYIDIVDATFIQRYATGIEVPFPIDILMQGDVDGDNDITSVDSTFIMRYLIRMYVPYDIGEYVARTSLVFE